MAQEHKLKIDKLTLEVGQVITLLDPPLVMHQPTLFTLGLLGQTNFYNAVVLLANPELIAKPTSQIEGIQLSTFDIIMQILRGQDDASKAYAGLIITLLSILFPQYEIKIAGNMLLFNSLKEKSQVIVTTENYECIKQAIIEIFCLEDILGKDASIKAEDTPMVRRIKEKLKKRHEVLAKKKRGSGEMDILSRNISIVSVGLGLSINEIKQYTVYQLFDIFKRAQLKDAFDLYVARATSFGGVKKNEKIENWQKNLTETSDN